MNCANILKMRFYLERRLGMGYEEKWREHTEKYQKLCVEHDTIPDELFREYGVNRGLRDINGNGVLTGLTTISRIDSFKMEESSLRRKALVPGLRCDRTDQKNSE